MPSIQCIIYMVKTKPLTLKYWPIGCRFRFYKNEVKICITESFLAPSPTLMCNILLSAIQHP